MRTMRRTGFGLGLALTLVGTGCPGDDGGGSGTEGASESGSTGSPTTGATTMVADSTGVDPSATDDAESSSGEGPTEELLGSCDGVTLPPRPADTAARGPWAVGARTVQLDGLTVEVWYPAEPGSEAGVDPVVYDIRLALPESEQGKIPDSDNPWQPCDCYRDLPIDGASGPYPVVMFVHGTAGFRTQSLEHMTHWASRGFVVMAADHPGLWLADLLGSICGAGMVPRDLEGDLATMLSAVRGELGGLEDLGDRLDADRIGTAGHSAGGGAVSTTGDFSQVIIPMAAGGVEAGSALQSSLILGAVSDSVVAYGSQLDGYDATPARKRLVGIANTGHLAFSGMCSLANEAGEDLLTIANNYDVCGVGFAGALFQCDDSFLPDPEAWEITNFASSAVLEETLHCEPAAVDQLALIQGRYPVVLDFFEEL